MFTKNQEIEYYGKKITLIDRVEVPTGNKLILYWVYLSDNTTSPKITPESDLAEVIKELQAA